MVLYANVSLEKDKEHVNLLSQQARAGFIVRGTLSIGHDFYLAVGSLKSHLVLSSYNEELT